MHLLDSIRVLRQCNIIELSPKSTSSDTFDEIHQVVLGVISDNMASLVESGTYGAINKTDTSTNSFFIMLTSGAYTLKENTTIYGQIITAGELVVKSQYLCYMQIDTNCYWNQKSQHLAITVPTHTILHPQLEVNTVTYFHTIPTSVCTRTQSKKDISIHPICLTDSDYYDILEEIGCQNKI